MWASGPNVTLRARSSTQLESLDPEVDGRAQPRTRPLLRAIRARAIVLATVQVAGPCAPARANQLVSDYGRRRQRAMVLGHHALWLTLASLVRVTALLTSTARGRGARAQLRAKPQMNELSRRQLPRAAAEPRAALRPPVNLVKEVALLARRLRTSTVRDIGHRAQAIANQLQIAYGHRPRHPLGVALRALQQLPAPLATVAVPATSTATEAGRVVALTAVECGLRQRHRAAPAHSVQKHGRANLDKMTALQDAV